MLIIVGNKVSKQVIDLSLDCRGNYIQLDIARLHCGTNGIAAYNPYGEFLDVYLNYSQVLDHIYGRPMKYSVIESSVGALVDYLRSEKYKGLPDFSLMCERFNVMIRDKKLRRKIAKDKRDKERRDCADYINKRNTL